MSNTKSLILRASLLTLAMALTLRQAASQSSQRTFSTPQAAARL
jgi:hypothetical protein